MVVQSSRSSGWIFALGTNSPLPDQPGVGFRHGLVDPVPGIIKAPAFAFGPVSGPQIGVLEIALQRVCEL